MLTHRAANLLVMALTVSLCAVGCQGSEDAEPESDESTSVPSTEDGGDEGAEAEADVDTEFEADAEPELDTALGEAASGATLSLPEPICSGLGVDVGAADGWESRTTIPIAENTATVSFAARPTAGNLNGLFAVGSGEIDEFSDAPVSVRFADTGSMDARDGDEYRNDSAYVYAPGAWHTIVIEMDIRNQTYDVVIGRCGEAFTPVITGATFRDDASVKDQLDTWAVWSSQDAPLEVGSVTWTAT